MRQNTAKDKWNSYRPYDFDKNENKVIAEMFTVETMLLPDPLVS